MDKKQEILRPFLVLAAVLLNGWDRWLGKSKIDLILERDLRTLYPEQELGQARWEFRVKRLGIALGVSCLGLLCTLPVLLGELSAETQLSETGIVRGEYGDGDRQVQLQVQYGEYQASLKLAVGARVYSEEEIGHLAEAFREHLPQLILQNNEALDRVETDLCLEETYEGYPFLVSWYSANEEYIDRTGRIMKQTGEPRLVELHAVFSYELWEWEQLLEITLLPGGVQIQEGEYQRRERLKEYLVESEQSSRSGQRWQLPSHWEGQPLAYQISEECVSPGLLLLFLVSAVLVFAFARKDLHQKYLERQQELRRDYAELLHQLTLYLGAGLTIRGSLQKIRESYGKTLAQEGYSRVAFEEVGYVCRELATGVTEVQAYENWSRRTGLPEYTQLCTLLIQNLQKGSTGLVQRLREEGEQARRDYLHHCKKRSEEAQTKLLLPLVLMLVVVMLLILIPAFSVTGI